MIMEKPAGLYWRRNDLMPTASSLGSAGLHKKCLPPPFRESSYKIKTTCSYSIRDSLPNVMRTTDGLWIVLNGLQWAFQPLEGGKHRRHSLPHFHRTPRLSPEEEVHIKGYIRRHDRGKLTPITGQGWLIGRRAGRFGLEIPMTLVRRRQLLS